MDLGISLRMALAKRDMKNKDLAEALNTTSQQVSTWISRSSINMSNIQRICKVLDMKVSEFIALSE